MIVHALRYSRPLIRQWAKLAIVLFFLGIFFSFTFTFDENQLDRTIIEKVATLRHPGLTGHAIDITALGSVTLLTLFTVFLLALFGMKRKWLEFSQLLIAQAGVGLISWSTKAFYMRPRPSVLEHLVEVSNYSYPSGHALSTTTFYVTIGLLLCEWYRTHWSRVTIFCLGLFIILLVSASRIYLGVHYPSDVMGGMALGAAWALIIPALLSFGKRRTERPDHGHKPHAHS